MLSGVHGTALFRANNLILVSGPSTSRPSDLQMLSSRADGILLTAPNGTKNNRDADEVIRELASLGAPIIGIVS